ncbi:MAG: 50S ribosomal protein L25/general stress protein Ctc [Acidimicrobiaceae bacterium]|nr:50S ribosomal protein L25/general stress protein Ctc [Acidimicrobiaceae bacterium]
MAVFEINAELRKDKGKGASRRLRRNADMIPAILYGSGIEPTPLTIAHKEIYKACENEAFFSHIITINADGVSQKAIVKDLQRHPAKDRIMHADFLRIQMDQPITVEVPLHFVNEASCLGVRLGGGNISRTMTSIEINCLPGDLPEYIEVDLEDLDLGASLHITDLKLPKGLTVPSLQQGADHDHVVVSINAPKRSEEPDEETLSAEESGESEPNSDDEPAIE